MVRTALDIGLIARSSRYRTAGARRPVVLLGVLVLVASLPASGLAAAATSGGSSQADTSVRSGGNHYLVLQVRGAG